MNRPSLTSVVAFQRVTELTGLWPRINGPQLPDHGDARASRSSHYRPKGRHPKEWLRPFHGVATACLDHYLGWRRTIEALGELSLKQYPNIKVGENFTGYKK
jgi:hypothetical protein